MDFENKNYYELLGLGTLTQEERENLSFSSIEKAYLREKYSEYTPAWELKEIEEAFKVLSTPEKKKEYDKYLNSKTIVPSASSSQPEPPVQPEPMAQPEPEPFNIFQINRGEPSSHKNIKNSQITSKITSKLSNLSKVLIPVAGAAVGFTFAGGIVGIAAGIAVGSLASAILHKKPIKFKLVKKLKEMKITKITTEESKLIEEYNKKLEDQIYKLLSEPHNNYNLQIALSRYENQVELLRKRMEIKKNEKVKKGELLKYKLELTLLKNQLETAEKRIEVIREKIDIYDDKKKEQKLSKINKKISKTEQDIKEKESNKVLGIAKLKIKKSNLLGKRDRIAKRIKLTNDMVGKVQDGFIKAYDIVRNIKNVFVPIETIDQELFSNAPKSK